MDQINETASLQSAWGAPVVAVICENCDWTFLLPANQPSECCPHCFAADLTRLGEQLDPMPWLRPPELVEPYHLAPAEAARVAHEFFKGIPFPSTDLSPQQLQARLQRIFLPIWLVDVSVQGTWSAQVGYNYEVVSHQDRFEENLNGWTSQQVKERRVRWEPRVGRLKRAYTNVSAPALEDHSILARRLGDLTAPNAQPFRPELLDGTLVRLPDRTPADAWPAAEPQVQSLAQEECKQAAGADAIQEYGWQPVWENYNWTLLLLPFYTTYYLDDESKPQAVMIHGRTGKTNGARRASMRRAQQAAWVTLAIAAVIFFLGLIVTMAAVVFPPAFPVGMVGIGLALLVALGAAIPITVAWQYNREQKGR